MTKCDAYVKHEMCLEIHTNDSYRQEVIGHSVVNHCVGPDISAASQYFSKNCI